MRAPVLLLDEPLASLDPLARREFLHVLVDAVRADGATALLSSHVITDIEQACDRLLVLGGGRTLLDLSIAGAIAEHRRRRRRPTRTGRRAAATGDRRRDASRVRPASASASSAATLAPAAARRPSRRSSSATSPPAGRRGRPSATDGARGMSVRLARASPSGSTASSWSRSVSRSVGLIVALVRRGRLHRQPPARRRMLRRSTDDSIRVACQRALDAFDDAQRSLGGLLLTPLLLVTYAIGLFLGVPIVARELERGTVRLAWSLAPSRWRWYLRSRCCPILVVARRPDVRRRRRRRPVLRREPAGRRHRRTRSTAYGARGGLLAAPGGLHLRRRGRRSGRSSGGRCRRSSSRRWSRRSGSSAASGPPADPRRRGGRRSRSDRRSTARRTASGDMYIDQKFVLPDGTLVGYDYFGDQAARVRSTRTATRSTRWSSSSSRASATGSSRPARRLVAGRRLARRAALAGFVVARRRPG